MVYVMVPLVQIELADFRDVVWNSHRIKDVVWNSRDTKPYSLISRRIYFAN